MAQGLTRVQFELLQFIKSYQQSNFIAPSYHEMMVAMGMKSKSSIHRIMKRLVERGHIRQAKFRARTIEVVEPGHQAPSAVTPKPTVTIVLDFVNRVQHTHTTGDVIVLYRRTDLAR